MESKSLNLKLEKIGTYADIYVNDHLIGSVDNLYRTYYFNLHKATQNGLTLTKRNNRLTIRIASTMRKTTELKAKFGDKQTSVGPWYT